MIRFWTAGIAVLFVLTVFQGCMLPGRLTRLVATSLPRPAFDAPPPLPDGVAVYSDTVRGPYMEVKARVKAFFTVPLLVYTYSREKIECTISGKRYMMDVSKRVSELCAGEYRERLKGMNCRITVRQVPAKFLHEFHSHIVMLRYGFNLNFEKMLYPGGEIVIEYNFTRVETPDVVRHGEIHETLSEFTYQRYPYESRRRMVQSFTSRINDYIDLRCDHAARRALDAISSL